MNAVGIDVSKGKKYGYNSETIWGDCIPLLLRLSTHPVISIHLLNLFILSKVNPGCNGTYRPLLRSTCSPAFSSRSLCQCC